MKLGRRAFLAAPLAPVLAGCTALEAVQQAMSTAPLVATPAPRTFRIAYPKLDYYLNLKNRLHNLTHRLRLDSPATVELNAVGLSIGLPEEQSLDLPPPMAQVPGVYAKRLGADSAFKSDLVVADPFTLPALGAAGVLHDLGPLLARERWFDREDYLGGALATGEYQGKQLALPIEVAVEVLWQSRSAFATRGVPLAIERWNWEQLLDASRRLTPSPGQRPWGYQVTPALPSLWSLAWQQGAALVSQDGARMELGEPGTLRALDFLGDLVNVHKVAPLYETPLPAEETYPIGRAYLIGGGGFGRSLPPGVAMAGGLIGGPFFARPQDALLAALPSDRAPTTLGVALAMLAVPRHAADLARSFSLLHAFLDAAAGPLFLPTRRGMSDLRTDELGLSDAEARTLAASVGAARYLPTGFPLDVVPILHRELLLPVLAGKKTAQVAARDARLPIESRLRQGGA